MAPGEQRGATPADLTPEQIAQTPWHATAPDQTLAALGTTPSGLSEEEVQRRRERFGPNRLPEEKPTSVAVLFLRQFKSPLIYVLLAAAAVSLAIGDRSDAAFIFAVLLLNAVIGAFQEGRAQSAAQALKQLVQITTPVCRGGKRHEVEAESLVPGDIVLIEAGMTVPADLRLVRGEEVRADESLLTGESMPVEKSADEQLDEDTPLGDRITLLHAGSTVLGGRSTGVVCRTGNRTELGQIAVSLSTGKGQVPPLVIRLQRFAQLIALVVLVAVAALGAVEFARGEPLVQIFFLAVALAVSTIPEGLPVAITVALSVASSRMARRNVIVRQLAAVEGLGACTLIASDKTGTLTVNRLTIQRLVRPDGMSVEIGGEGFEPEGELERDGNPVGDEERVWAEELATAAALANAAEYRIEEDGTLSQQGDTVDVAFLVLAAKLGLSRPELLEQMEEVRIIPYESERRFSASINRRNGRLVAHVKGAAETVVRMCNADAEAVGRLEEELAGHGYRVLAVASGPVGEGSANGEHETLTGLRFLGLVGLIDPIRPEALDAVKRCSDAGVDVRMVTGDHPATALAIARQLGITRSPDDVITGGEISAIEEADGEQGTAGRSTEEIVARLQHVHVYARVEPRQKTAIVKALQEAGHFVAVTGDGVNDAPALRKAHIGVAMGKAGTDVARQAADLILTDDNFASVVNGIEEGRIAYDNIRKVVWLLVSTGAAELVLFTLAVIFNTPLPLTPVQLLWLNLVTNGIQHVALTFEKGEPDVLERAPRPPKQGIFDRLMLEEIIVSGAYMGLVAFGLFYVLLEVRQMNLFDARNLLLLLMVLFENAHVLNCRSEIRSIVRVPLSANWLVIGALVLAQLIHIGSMFIPGWNDLLEIRPVEFTTWSGLLGIAVTIILVMECYKALRARRIRRGGGASRMRGRPAREDQ